MLTTQEQTEVDEALKTISKGAAKLIKRELREAVRLHDALVRVYDSGGGGMSYNYHQQVGRMIGAAFLRQREVEGRSTQGG
jgi:hypothetical protein